jgi:hypothetical protein
MGKNLDTYNTYYEASWADPPSSHFAANEKYLSENFQNLDREGNVMMDKAAYMGMVRILNDAFSNFKAVLSDVHEEGDAVILSSHFEGTHTGDLDLSALGMGIFPASGKRIVWPEASTTWKFDGDQILSIQPNDDNGGVGPFLAALASE